MMYKISIEYALNGIIAQVGCQRVVFTKIDAFLTELHDYLTDPRGTEARWRKTMQMFNSIDTEIPPELTCPQPTAYVEPPAPPQDCSMGQTQR